MSTEPLRFLVAVRKLAEKQDIFIYDCSATECTEAKVVSTGEEIENVSVVERLEQFILGATVLSQIETKRFATWNLTSTLMLLPTSSSWGNADGIEVHDMEIGVDTKYILSGRSGRSAFRSANYLNDRMSSFCDSDGLFIRTRAIKGEDHILVVVDDQILKTDCRSTTRPLEILRSSATDLDYVQTLGSSVTSIVTGELGGVWKLAIQGLVRGNIVVEPPKNYHATRTATVEDEIVVFAGSTEAGLRIVKGTPLGLLRCDLGTVL